ncbi:MAG: hypothetical protein QG588_1062, partial [Candidatus Poribacteria bacterium]|nr:hypothetical protein [Candidatus Poribacteria bacterium]
TLDQLGLSEKIDECKALTLWNDVASTLASRTQPVSISNSRLIVNVTDSVVLHTLSLYKRKYVEKINLLAGRDVIKDIIFRVSKVEKKDIELKDRDNYMEEFKGTQLDQGELEKIDEIVSTIEDDDIKNSLRNLFINQSKLTKMRRKGL